MNPVTETVEFKTLAAELYKKNLNLFNANRTLTILQKLYQIMAAALKTEDLAQQFMNTIVVDMNFVSGVAYLKSAQDNTLDPVAQVKTDQNSLKKVDINDQTNIVAKAFLEKQKVTANHDIAFPIIFGTEILGVFTIYLGVNTESLSETDNDILNRVTVVFAVALDRLLLYQNLESVNEKLKFLDKQKTEFLNVASHELRAPMTAIKGYISMTQSGDGGEIPVAAQELLSEAATETDRMIRLVNNMLNVARIEEGRMVFAEGQVHLLEVVERVFNEFNFEAENKALKYSYQPTPNTSDFVTVDVDRIHEVVANLVNNAIKYTDEGEIVVKVFNPNPQIVRFEVTDTGPGMTPDEVGKLFQKFYRADSYIGKKMGTGLGLYISKLLVGKFGGKIGVVSEKSKGSTFWFELPVKG